MRDKRLWFGPGAHSAIIAVALLVASTGAVAQETVLHSFNRNNGAAPAGLIFDANGNLYGTASEGGAHGYGTVYELIPQAGGGWIEKVLHSFDGLDGDGPTTTLIFDSARNLYGTTVYGGMHLGGTVFELTPQTDGGWREKVLHHFASERRDGANPVAGVIFDAAGNLYGTTRSGGTKGGGTAFQLTPTAGGLWTEKILHSFKASNGYYVLSGMIFDAAGNLYGTTYAGGVNGWGTVFELTPSGSGVWSYRVLHNFGYLGQGGHSPSTGLIMDALGSLYGINAGGGNRNGCPYRGWGCGTVFELTPQANGGWTEKVLYSFNPGGGGFTPGGGLTFDASGNLYGTTSAGGNGTGCKVENGCGTVFELTPNASGNWTEKVLHTFNKNGSDGVIPNDGLIFDARGNLYGTTFGGGNHDGGTVFELIP